MPQTFLRLCAAGSRSAAIVLALPDARYHLPRQVNWRLSSQRGNVQLGETRTVMVCLHDLEPGTRYRFEAEGELLEFRTEPCAGAVRLDQFGASEDAEDNREAFARAIAAVLHGGTLIVPRGTWKTGPVQLKSAMTLYLEDGAVLAAIGERGGWPVLEAQDDDGKMLGSWEGLPARCYAGVVNAVGAQALSITGQGVIDGGGDRGDWWTWPKETREGARRPRLMHLIGCEEVLLLGVTICNSPSWTVHPQGCNRLIAAGLHISNPPDSPNTDGLDPESCTDVLIEGVRFSVGDDCIAIKSGKRTASQICHLAPTRGVTVRHCLMERGHGGVVLGSEMSGGIHDVLVEDCEMVDTDRGLRIKTRRGRGGTVSGVTFRRVDMDGVHAALTANAFYFCDPDGHDAWVQDRAPALVDVTTPEIRDILVEDVRLKNVSVAAGAFLGLPEAPITGIRVRDMSVTYAPDGQAGVPVMADGVRSMRHMPLVIENAELICETTGSGPQLEICEGVSS
ncbi:polygalacturonase PglA [Roseibium suaedae]|uniref:polygalacturonase PglA n=1 Tax=Roseibium suaedae TaxID=735517 RepID=UPI000933D89F|nr:glycoside hydrolase family 28 protein [Roseibium suaedae]